MNNFIGYQPGKTWIHELTGASKFLFFLLTSIAAMITYDTRLLLAIAFVSLVALRLSRISWKNIRWVIYFASFFAVMNLLMVYLFSPEYGVEIYGSRHLIWAGVGPFSLTQEELFYLSNLFLKYVATLPLALVFLLTTHPSQFAASLNQIGVSYRIAYAVSLTLRYIPDVQEDFVMIRKSQEARGLDLSSNQPLFTRIRGNALILFPLILTSLERIETISRAMELRRFGKEKRRTWYWTQAWSWQDVLLLGLALLSLLLALYLMWVQGSRFYNPWSL
ncbi:energy-coupling factor transporter transmembrane component T [Streptococcus sp. NLN76]|uniref:energy-coupling factor transporter transmembrane component T family protein n=1 Tax=Streptococcus sp. NLN76 TaxID=2822800 RepID=UPI0018A973A4|nr:energy-coupling factor transporter transmembrane component T [Streptococcus sp. NLN76]MBF8970874.1 energy-coupling factor transporter transmembrane protein EcfT [Streptococcus sp. NLN76]